MEITTIHISPRARGLMERWLEDVTGAIPHPNLIAVQRATLLTMDEFRRLQAGQNVQVQMASVEGFRLDCSVEHTRNPEEEACPLLRLEAGDGFSVDGSSEAHRR